MVGTAVTVAEVHLPAVPETELARAADYARAEKAAATRRAYQSDFAIFSAWCAERGLSPLPANPESVAAFHPLPTDDERVRATVRGIRRTIGLLLSKSSPPWLSASCIWRKPERA